MSAEGHVPPPRRPIPKPLRWLAWWCVIGTAWVILPAQTAWWTFFGVLMVQWSAHAACALVVPLVIWRRLRVHCLMVLTLIALGLWPWWTAAWSSRSAPVGDADLTVASFNVLFSNAQTAAEIPAVRECQADMLVLIETDAKDEASLRDDPRWPYQRWVPDRAVGGEPIGMAVLSRRPVDGFVIHHLGGTAAIEARMICAGQRLHLLACHPTAPLSSDLWRQRDEQFGRLAEVVKPMQGPVVVLGDLNMTVADPAWRRLSRDAGLRRAGGKAPATWPWLFGPFGIAIDHVLAGNGARVGGVRAVVIDGSDHRGVAAAISVR